MEHVSRCSGGVAKLLHLHVKGKYFDDIKSGTKTEEYRHFATWVNKLMPRAVNVFAIRVN